MISRRRFVGCISLIALAPGVLADTYVIDKLEQAKNKTVYFPAGNYFIRQPILVRLTKSLSVHCHPDARFIAVKGFPVGKKLFHFNSGNSSGIRFEWRGGQFHGQDMPPRTSGAPNVFALIGWGIDRAVIRDAEFFRFKKGSRGGTALFIAAVNSFEVTGCKFHGAGDAGIYISGNQAQTHGERGLVSGCHFFDVSVGVIAKRNFHSLIVDNSHFRNSIHGVVVGGEADKNKLSGNISIISNNTFSGVVKSIEFRNTSYGIARSNIIQGVGIHGGGDGRVVPNAGISIRGSSYCQVYGNTVITIQGQHAYARAFQFIDIESKKPDSYRHAVSHNNSISNNMVVGNIQEIVNWSDGNNNVFEG